MNREQIKQAANEYADKEWPFDGYCASSDSFAAGADWRINSVWHDMKTEEPQVYGEYKNRVYPQIPCLVYGKLSTGIGYGVRYWNITEKCWDDEECDDYECSKDAIEEWAYLDDLLPDRKEDCK